MLIIAKQFASLIDENKFEEAAQLIAEDCTYHYFEGNYAGCESIVNIYRMHHKMGQEHFDEMRNSSEAEELPDVRFNDLIRMGERWHATHSEEILTISDGLIRHIEHITLREEAQAFREFMREVHEA